MNRCIAMLHMCINTHSFNVNVTVVSLIFKGHASIFCYSFCLNTCFSVTVETSQCSFGSKSGKTFFVWLLVLVLESLNGRNDNTLF